MFAKIRVVSACWLLLGFILLFSQPSSAQERLCDPSFEDCYTPLLDLVRAENVGIDMAFYMIELPGLANAIIARHQAGVPVRIIVEPRANLKFPGNQAILDQFRTAGIPMRYKLGDGIVHVKLMLLAGQNKVVFTGSNFGDGDVRPYVPYDNYVDGAWYISDDSAVVNSFKTRYDDTWTNTNLYGNYANIPGALTRRYPTFPIDPAMNFVPNQNASEDYATRTIPLIDQETQKIDLIMYRVTDISICDAALRAVARGLQVRLLAEPHEYRFDSSRLGAELTGPYNIDRMYAAGVQIKMRKHRGLNHQKSVLLYGQGMTIFGSSNWSWQSFNYQEEHNYFTTKPWFFNWFVNQFERKWNSATEFEAFVPLSPDIPVNLSPGNGAGVGAAPVTLTWEGGPWAHRYDIYLGTSSSNLSLIASDVNTGALGSSASETYVVSGLQAGTTYFWRVVGKTMANRTASGPVWSFTTSGTAPAGPMITAISPNSGTTAGGTSVTITGSNFLSGASLTLGGSPATNVTLISSSSMTATTPPHSAGAVNVLVTNPGGQNATLASGYTYSSPSPPPSPPTVSSISPNSGTTAGGTSVTITGTNFLSGAAVTIGGTAAANVTVTSATTITATTPPHAAGAVTVIVTNSNGLSGSLANGFTYSAPSETALLEDSFNDNSLDLTKWTPHNLFSGFTDTAVAVNETNQQMQIGPLPLGQTGSHYNGIRSANAHDFTGAYCQVEMVQAPVSSTKADAMLTLGKDANNYYRVYVEEGTVICQKRISGVKTNLFTAAYNAAGHRYWRIRHDQATGNVVFETAPDNSGVPGSWVLRYSEVWNSASVPLSSIIFEIKAGTWQVESVTPGLVIFDNFRVARP